MPAERRVGSTTSETRASILAATEQLMVDKGYASVTSRRVAAAVGEGSMAIAFVHQYLREGEPRLEPAGAQRA